MNNLHASANVLKSAKRASVWLLTSAGGGGGFSYADATDSVNACTSLFISLVKLDWSRFLNQLSCVDGRMNLDDRGFAFLRQLLLAEKTTKATAARLSRSVLELLSWAALAAWSPCQDLRICISMCLRLACLRAFEGVSQHLWPVFRGRPVTPPYKWTKLWPRPSNCSRFVTLGIKEMQAFAASVCSRHMPPLSPVGAFTPVPAVPAWLCPPPLFSARCLLLQMHCFRMTHCMQDSRLVFPQAVPLSSTAFTKPLSTLS